MGRRGAERFGLVAIGVKEDGFDSPQEIRRGPRTNNPLERLNREIRRLTRVARAFPDGRSGLILVAARLRPVASTRWDTKPYLAMRHVRVGEGVGRVDGVTSTPVAVSHPQEEREETEFGEATPGAKCGGSLTRPSLQSPCGAEPRNVAPTRRGAVPDAA